MIRHIFVDSLYPVPVFGSVVTVFFCQVAKIISFQESAHWLHFLNVINGAVLLCKILEQNRNLQFVTSST